MKHLQLVISAVLVAVYVLGVNGLPLGESNDGAGGNGPDSEESDNPINVTDGSRGIYINANGIVLGLLPKTEYSVSQLSKALSGVDRDSLAFSLGLTPFRDISTTFTLLFNGQSRNPQNKAINYEIAVVFAETLSKGLPRTPRSLKALSYIMLRVKQLQDEGKTVTPELRSELIQQAFDYFYGADFAGVPSKEKWLSQAATIDKAVEGDFDAARKLVDFLESENRDFQGLTQLGLRLQESILQGAVESVVNGKGSLQFQPGYIFE